MVYKSLIILGGFRPHLSVDKLEKLLARHRAGNEETLGLVAAHGFEQIECFERLHAFGHHFDTGVGIEHVAQPFADERVIVRDQHADTRRLGRGAADSGSRGMAGPVRGWVISRPRTQDRASAR